MGCGCKKRREEALQAAEHATRIKLTEGGEVKSPSPSPAPSLEDATNIVNKLNEINS